MANAGQLRHRVKIEHVVITKDSFGGTVEDWQTFVEAWAAVEPLSGKGFFAAQQAQSEVTVRVTIRYRAGIDPTMRVRRDFAAAEQITLTGTDPAALIHKNAEGAEAENIVVTNLAGTVTYGRGVDYAVGVNSQGQTTIARIAGGAIGDGDTVSAAYEYKRIHPIEHIIHLGERKRLLQLLCREAQT